jgi:hypothetical protein
MPVERFAVGGCGVEGSCGEPAFTCVEKGEEIETVEVVERVEVWTFDAGRRQSRGSYGQLSEMVVVKGMKKFSKDTGGWPATSLSRRRGLERISQFIPLIGLQSKGS